LITFKSYRNNLPLLKITSCAVVAERERRVVFCIAAPFFAGGKVLGFLLSLGGGRLRKGTRNERYNNSADHLFEPFR
jgi:hypothetical protein